MNQSSQYYYDIDEILRTYGSTVELDNLNLYPFTIVSAVGVVLNLFTCLVYRQSEFRVISVYQYFFVYAVTNIVLCLFSCFNFLATSYRIISWSNSYWTQFYYNYIYSPGINICYFYSSVLDIFILLDRLAVFNVSIKNWFTRIRPNKMCLIGLVVCLVVDSPYFYVFMPSSVEKRIDANTNFTIWFASNTPFATSNIGRALSYLVYSIRDVLVLVIKVILNIVSTITLKRFLDKKLKIVSSNRIQPIEMSMAQVNNKSRIMTTELGSTTNPANKNETSSSYKATKANRNSAIMVIVICTISFITHLLTMTMILYANFNFNIYVFILYFLGDFCLPLKACIDFVVFFSFNNKFREACYRILRIRGVTS